ncbi:MAG: DUF805 domain-containing protein [Alphaproteobacteria bacterium]|nr:DUF805 domain-containing protein [Alphaproteobacteria bacterium]
MEFKDAVKSAFSKYFTISGRACRSEYWYYVLFIILVGFGLMMVSMIIPFLMMLNMVFSLATIIPSITVGIRRLHDIDRSGWWMLIGFVPLIGGIVLLIFFVKKGTEGPNDFGDDPLAHVEDV